MSAAVLKLDVQIKSASMAAAVAKLRAGVTDLGTIHAMIAVRAENATREYLRNLAIDPAAHATANRFGQRPTGWFSRAAGNVTHRASADSAVVVVTAPGMTRAFRDVTITPINGNWLTIPVHAKAFGRRASSLERLIGTRLFRPLRKGATASASNLLEPPGPRRKGVDRRSKRFNSADRANVLAASVNGKLVIFYALSKRVELKQDRALLPPDDLYQHVAEVAAAVYMQRLAEAGRVS